MVRALTHAEIDKEKWDQTIISSHNCLPYALSFYLDIVCPQWQALVNEDYSCVMPLTARRKYGIDYLFQPHFTQQSGLFSKNRISRSTLLDFLNAIPDKFRLIEICLNSTNSELLLQTAPTKKEAGFTWKENSNYELDLNKRYDEIFRSYSENTRRNIKKAMKSGVTISKDEAGIDDIITLFRKNKGKEFAHLKNDYYELLRSLVEEGKKRNCIELTAVKTKEGRLCAGAVFFIFQKRAIFLFSATDTEAKSTGAMFFLLNDFISQHAGSLSILDFEGSNDAALARFYKSFGAKEFVFLQLKKNNLPKYIQWLKQ